MKKLIYIAGNNFTKWNKEKKEWEGNHLEWGLIGAYESLETIFHNAFEHNKRSDEYPVFITAVLEGESLSFDKIDGTMKWYFYPFLDKDPILDEAKIIKILSRNEKTK